MFGQNLEDLLRAARGMFTWRIRKPPRKVKIHPRGKEGQDGLGWLKDYWQIWNPEGKNDSEHGLCL